MTESDDVPKREKKARVKRGPPKPVAAPETPVPAQDQGHEGSEKRPPRKHSVNCAPEELRCGWMVTSKGGDTTRCTRYTWKQADGSRSQYCLAHANTRAARDIMAASGRKRWEENTAQKERQKVLMAEVGVEEILTQDDVSLARRRVLFQVSKGKLPAAAANVLLTGIAQASEHIEKFGGKQGVEGGSGYLRLMPGVKLVEQETEANRALTSEEMKQLYELMMKHKREGGRVPGTWEERLLLYLGKRRPAEVAYDDKTHEPVGEYRCDVEVDPKTGAKSVKRLFVPYTSQLLTKERVALEEQALNKSGKKEPK